MNSVQNKEEELQNQLSEAFLHMNIQELLTIVHESPKIVRQVFEQTLMALDLKELDERFIGFCFFVIEELIKIYGIPVIMMLNTTEAAHILSASANSGHQREVVNLIGLSLLYFSFDDERKTIPFIKDLWIKLNPSVPFPCEVQKPTKFIHIFWNTQNVLETYNSLQKCSDKQKNDFYLFVKEMVEFEDFSDPGFNPLERELMESYFVQVLNVLSVLELEVLGSPTRSRKIQGDLEEEEKGSKSVPPQNFKNVQSTQNIQKIEDSQMVQNFQNVKNTQNTQQVRAVQMPMSEERKERMEQESPLQNRNSSPLAIKEAAPIKNKQRLMTSFILNERLGRDEGDNTEYKLYSYPLREEAFKTLKKTICSFLNRRGGRIYIGVDDERYVKGMQLTAKQRDQIKLDIQDLIRDFEPSILNEEVVKVLFLPIFHTDRNINLPGLFIVKIVVKQGDTSKLYSSTRAYLQCYIRNDGQSVQLTARETTEYILKRDKNPENRIPLDEFDDPQPEEIEDVEVQHPRLKPNKLWLTKDVKKHQNTGNSAKQNIKETSFAWVEKQVPPPNDHASNIQNQQHNDVVLPEPGWREKAGVSPNQEIFEVLVTGLPNGTTKKQFKDLFMPTKYKSVVYCTIATEKGGTHKGVVCFKDIGEADLFIRDVNFRKYFGAILRAEFNFAT